jgi:hypothetical protein
MYRLQPARDSHRKYRSGPVRRLHDAPRPMAPLDWTGQVGPYFWCIDPPLPRSYGASGLIHRITPGEGTAIVRRLVIAIAITASMLAAAPAALAASCNSPSHTITLSQGKATPGTGTTSTLFTFSVKYSDSAGCVPSSVKVSVAGVGAFAMTGSPGNYFAGVIFTRGIRLPVGTHAYSFTATSGTGNGVKSLTITAVNPASVVVAATSTPTPKPTPTPTPKPTPAPTPKPTPKPTPRPTATPSPGATPTGTGTPSPAASPSPTPRPRHHASPTPLATTATPTASPAGGVGGPGASTAPPAGGGIARLDGGGPSLMIGAWMFTTAGGLALFMFLAPRRRTLLTRTAATAMPMPTPVAASPALPVAPEPRVSKERSSDDEANMPRWLRPSVQAARHGGGAGGSRSGSRRTRTF